MAIGGALAGPLARLAPVSSLGGAFLVFVAGLAAFLTLAYAVMTAIIHRRRRA